MSNEQITFASIKNAADAAQLIGAGTEGAALVAFIGGKADKAGAILADAYAIAYRTAMNYGAVELVRRVTAACTDKKGNVSKRPGAAPVFAAMDSVIKGAKRAKAQVKDCDDHAERAERAAVFAVRIVESLSAALESEAAERKAAAAVAKVEKAAKVEEAEKAAAAETAAVIREVQADKHEAIETAESLRQQLRAAQEENARLLAELNEARAMLAAAQEVKPSKVRKAKAEPLAA